MQPNPHPQPPRFGRRLLEVTCPHELYEEVRGDLDELYQRRLESSSKWKADLFYTWEALSAIRLQRVISSTSYDQDHTAMIKHYLKIGLRNIRKHTAYNVINIGGLAVGLACCLMIALYVQHEWSYDTWMDDADRIYRVPMEISSEGNIRGFSVIAAPVAPNLEKDYSQVENTLRLWQRGTRLVRLSDERVFYEDNAYYADPSFFAFFTLDMPEGDPSTALTRPNTVVLSQSTAERYFGNRPATGNTIEINNTEFEITGVMEDTPVNTHHDFNMILSWSTLGGWDQLENWHSTMFFTYVKLRPGTDAALFEEEIADYAYRYVADDLEEQKQSYTYRLQPVTDIHLYSDYSYEAKPGGSAAGVYMFSVIALLVLVIACMNFINLSTARSELRAREVGMRKVVGAVRTSLVGQFMGEAILLSFLSLLGAIIIYSVTLPWYNSLVGVEFGFDILRNPVTLAALISVTLFVGLAAGFYPAIVISSFNPLHVFRGRGKTTGRGTGLRKVLVVGQFAISVILIAGTITVYKQLNFMMDKELGFRTDQMLVLPIRGGFDLQEKYPLIKSEFGGFSSVEGITISSSVPGRGVSNYGIRIDREVNDMTQSMYHLFVDYDFTETYGLEIIAGRDFDQSYGEDLGKTFLINEAAVKSFGWSTPDQAIGKVLQSGAGGFKGEVVGVFKNFHYRSVDHIVEPLVLNIRNEGFSAITLRLKTGDLSMAIDQVRAEWASVFPGKPFNYFFLDESFNAQYNNYEQTGNILLTFSFLAIFIACLGLYGLAAFSAQQRTKEIGIRKVLGATVASLTFTVSKDFMKLVGAAVVLALPVSWWLIGTWLGQFAYRIDPGVSLFALAGGLALLIAVITVSWQSIRAALVNPARSLRTE